MELLDANSILPQPRTLAASTGFAPFADVFRINMIHQTDAVWVDCDVAALQPMPDIPYIFAPALRWIGNAVLRLPKTSPALALLLDLLNAEELVLPPDWPWKHLLPEAVKARTREGDAFALTEGERRELPYMTFGPVALTYALRKTGEDSFALPETALNPFHSIHFRRNYFRPRMARLEIPDHTLAIHHVGGKPFRVAFEKKGGFLPPHPGSFIAALCQKHGINPLDAPPKVSLPDPAAPADTDDTQ